VKSSFASAFQSILSKQVDETKEEGPILSKYKKPGKEVAEEQRKEKEMKEKRAEREKLRLMGRRIPTADDEEREREL
jgi:hypothetical protein